MLKSRYRGGARLLLPEEGALGGVAGVGAIRFFGGRTNSPREGTNFPTMGPIEALNVGSRTNGHADVLSQANRKALTTHNLLQQETGKVSQLTDKVETLRKLPRPFGGEIAFHPYF